jgi:hypothetical protein
MLLRYITWEIMCHLVTEHRMGNYASVTMVQPLHPAFKPMAVRIAATCNRFAARPHVQRWTEIEIRFARQVFEDIGFAFAGMASDGDARRFLLQIIAMMLSVPVEALSFMIDVDGPERDPPLLEQTLKLDAPGFELRVTLVSDPRTGRALYVRGLASQDLLHVEKKLGQILVRVHPFMIGRTEATGMHLLQLVQWTLEKNESKLVGFKAPVTHKSATLPDRQQVQSHVRNCARATITALEEMGAENGDQVYVSLQICPPCKPALVADSLSEFTERD